MLESAIVSVSDKKGLNELIEGIYQVNPDVEIISSGGTAEKIREFGYEVTDVSSYTGFPEAPGGLVKTLHPKVHGGIILNEDKDVEKEYLEKNKIKTFNLVVCNLYPFGKSAEGEAPRREIIENIDIGGPTLIRSAAKGALRHGGVAPVVEPEDYDKIIDEMLENNGELSEGTLRFLIHKAFNHTWKYDEKIRDWTEDKLGGEDTGISR